MRLNSRRPNGRDTLSAWLLDHLRLFHNITTSHDLQSQRIPILLRMRYTRFEKRRLTRQVRLVRPTDHQSSPSPPSLDILDDRPGPGRWILRISRFCLDGRFVVFHRKELGVSIQSRLITRLLCVEDESDSDVSVEVLPSSPQTDPFRFARAANESRRSHNCFKRFKSPSCNPKSLSSTLMRKTAPCGMVDSGSVVGFRITRETAWGEPG